MPNYPYKKMTKDLSLKELSTLNGNLDLIQEDIVDQKKRVDTLIQESPQPSEVVDARGGLPVLGDRLDKVDSDLTQKAPQDNVIDLEKKGRNLLSDADFEVLPRIIPRSDIYTFEAGITSPSYKGKKSLKIEAIGRETTTDPDKDFAFGLQLPIYPTDKLKISFWVYPLVSDKTINMRMAFSTVYTANVHLGLANQWNKVELELDVSTMSQASNRLYFDLRSSFAFYMSDFRAENITNRDEITPESLFQIGEKLQETPTAMHNSKGIVERMIKIAQSYRDKTDTFVYGNVYTAYDSSVQLVNGKHQIDCSSFANLLIHGVSYEDSRYNGKTENKHSKLFFNGEPYRYRFAHQMARYAHNKGYAFKPNSDFSNVEPGDVLFFSWNNGVSGDLEDGVREHAFMKIDHVAVFLHKRNEGHWATLQFDTGMTSVYYNATNGYMSQCVLAARFPFANVESMYPDENILVGGEVAREVSGASLVGTYRLNKPLIKGSYYTFVMDGDVLHDGHYFIVQANGQNLYSDSAKSIRYDGRVYIRFPYLQDQTSDQITLSIGRHSWSNATLAANVKWCALYEGYVQNKHEFNLPRNTLKDFPLSSSLVSDLNSALVPYYRYAVEGNKLIFNLNLPFTTARTGTLSLGNIGSDAPKTTQRIPLNAISEGLASTNICVLQVSSSGAVSIVPYDNSVVWRLVTCNGIVFRF